MKRLAAYAVAVMALLLSAGTTIAAEGGAVVATVPMAFAELSSDTCPYLPEGTLIKWSGTGTSITRTRTDASGVTTISATTVAHGVATDQDDNEYHFHYSNAYRLSNTVANQGLFSGPVIDSFTLAGNGPVKLSSGFVGIFTTDGTSSGVEPLSSRGDPISFAPFPQGYTNHCDPM